MFDAKVLIVLATLVILGILSIVAMVRYPAETFLKVMGLVGPIFTGILGSAATYYFQQKEVGRAQEQTVECGATLAELEAAQEEFGKQLDKLQSTLQQTGTAGPAGVHNLTQGIRTLKAKTADQQKSAATALGRLPPDLRIRIRPVKPGDGG